MFELGNDAPQVFHFRLSTLTSSLTSTATPQQLWTIMHWLSDTICLSVCLIYLYCLSPFGELAALLGWVCALTLGLCVNAMVFPGSAELCLQLVCPFLRKLQFLPQKTCRSFAPDVCPLEYQPKSVMMHSCSCILFLHWLGSFTYDTYITCNCPFSTAEGSVAQLFLNDADAFWAVRVVFML